MAIWKQEEIDKLIAETREGKTDEELVASHKRSLNGIMIKQKKEILKRVAAGEDIDSFNLTPERRALIVEEPVVKPVRVPVAKVTDDTVVSLLREMIELQKKILAKMEAD